MTKPRAPGTAEWGLMRALGLLGTEAVAAAVKKSVSWLHKCADPDDEAHRLPLHHAVTIDAACLRAGHEAPIRQAYDAEVATALAAMGGPAHAAANPLARFAVAMGEVGDVGQALAAMMADGKADQAELVRFAEQLGEARDAFAKLAKDIDAYRSNPMNTRALRAVPAGGIAAAAAAGDMVAAS